MDVRTVLRGRKNKFFGAQENVIKEYFDVCISLDNIQGGYWIAWSPHADADVSKDYLDVCISMDDIQGG